ncbi:hypothetical protein AM593_07101, partial [Mytilus galloprovincialis]
MGFAPCFCDILAILPVLCQVARPLEHLSCIKKYSFVRCVLVRQENLTPFGNATQSSNFSSNSKADNAIMMTLTQND